MSPDTALAPASEAPPAATAPAAGGPSALAPAPTPASGADEALPVATDLATIIREAHPVVQAVMALLAAAAFLSLTILVHKSVTFALAARHLRRCRALLRTAEGLDEAGERLAEAGGPASRGAGAAMIRAALAELALARRDPALVPGTAARAHAMLDRIASDAALGLRAGTGILASIGAIGPFVGLFGTVFGIMNSFLAIAETRTTNLAVVAPGVAEALLATGVGLAAAIPAVLIYNLLARRLAGHRHRLADLRVAVEILLGRALDRLAAGGAGTRAEAQPSACGASRAARPDGAIHRIAGE